MVGGLIKHLGMVVISITIVVVTTAVIKRLAKSKLCTQEVSSVDKTTVINETDVRRVGSIVGIVFR